MTTKRSSKLGNSPNRASASTYPREFFQRQPVTQKAGTCFVVMPFAARMTEVFATIRQAVEAAPWNFICKRADDFFAGGHVLLDVLRGIGEAQVVIADLTGKNPNVFYELGIAHMVKQPDEIILLTQNMKSVPFDLQAFRCIEYAQTIAGGKKLRDDIQRTLREIAAPVYRFQVDERSTYEFRDRLFGENRCLYNFSLRVDYAGANAAKFMLQLRRFVAGDPAPQLVSDTGHGLKVGGAQRVPKIPWELKLDRIDGSTSYFSLVEVPA